MVCLLLNNELMKQLITFVSDPCEDIYCGPNAECMLINGRPKCMCVTGYTGRPNNVAGCVDVNECLGNPCGKGALCRNEPGKFTCECPSNTEGNPYTGECKQLKAPGCSPTNPCPAGAECIVEQATGNNVCVCRRGFVRDPATNLCQDIDECSALGNRAPCGFNALCRNQIGSYSCECPPGFVGNPFSSCQECSTAECACLPPSKFIDGNCVLANCSIYKPCPTGAECVKLRDGQTYCSCPQGYHTLRDGRCEDIDECQLSNNQRVCAFGALCVNRPGKFECVCPEGYRGDPYNGVCSLAARIECERDTDCRANEKCVQPGECECPPPFFVDTTDNNKCKSPCERFPCGLNSLCTPSDPPRCMCRQGFIGDPLRGCADVNECDRNPCGSGALCINEIGGFKCECPPGTAGDPFRGCIPVGGSSSESRTEECDDDGDCGPDLACKEGGCVNPCAALPCGPNAICTVENSAAWCRCMPGFKESGNGCVSICQGYPCGENAQCLVAAEGLTCKCLDGFNGNPFPGGVCHPDVCSSSNPCESPQVCVQGRCKERCEGITCGVGAKCDKNTNRCVCLPFFIGNPDLLCVPRKS